MKRWTLAIILIILAAQSGFCGLLNPELVKRYAGKSDKDVLPVLIVLSDRVAAIKMGNDLHKKGTALSEIHQSVMEALQSKARASQGAVINRMRILGDAEQVSDLRPLWITNIISAKMTRAAAELIAAMPEVEEVGLDFEIQLRDAVETIPAGGARTNNVENGLNVIHATNVWAMGYRGEGRIVCNFDNGVDYTHPSLNSRWHGNHAPIQQSFWEPNGSQNNPSRCGGHGTLTMGVICGADGNNGDTIGVAPAAEWIAAKILCSGGSYISNAIMAYQWAADPDENPATMNDVPDVVSNSWGTTADCEGAGPGGWWEAIDNMEILGPVNVIAVDNSGTEGFASVNSPESRVSSLTKNFSVGNLNGNDPMLAIYPSSGRGPSPCDGITVKPEVTAPGTLIRSCAEGGGYSQATGTSMACPHVAGVITLMRQANPELTAEEIKQILLRSCTDLGQFGEDNDYGWGMINALTAVEQALSNSVSGSLQGTVTYGGLSIQGAKVYLLGTNTVFSAVTNSMGYFRFENVPSNRSYNLQAGKFGYEPFISTEPIFIPQLTQITDNFDLNRGYSDDGEIDQAWELGVSGDDATEGVWVRAVPVGSSDNGNPVQPSSDHSVSGTLCFVTANANSVEDPASQADVDGGKTTLRSPLFDLSDVNEPVLHFAYYYTNDQGDNSGGDFFKAQISADGGQTWVDMLNSSASPRAWQEAEYTVSNFVTPSDQMMIQFVAEDGAPPSLVEAMVDDIYISGSPGAPEPPRELVLDVQFDQVVLYWKAAEGAATYRVYMGGDPNNLIRSENYYTSTPDTTISIPMNQIPFSQFYFQVVAQR